MSYYQLYFTFATQFAMQDHIYKSVLRPLADYLIMFINGEELKKFKEFEAQNSSENLNLKDFTSSGPTSLNDALFNHSNIDGVKQDNEGNISLKNGKKVNVMEILQKLEKIDNQVDLQKGAMQGVI